MAMANGGLTLSGGYLTSAGAVSMASNFTPYLNIAQSCGTGAGCFPNVIYKCINGNISGNIDTSTGSAKYRLTNGTSIAFEMISSNCSGTYGSGRLANSICGTIFIDINGNKSSNIYGRDLFFFYITKTGILPIGTKEDTSHPIGSHCSNKSGTGLACAAWVVLRGNTKYLKGAVSW